MQFSTSLFEKEDEGITFWSSGDFPIWVFLLFFFAPQGVLFIMKTLENERYIAVMTYKLIVFEILKEFFVLPLLRVRGIPIYRVYRLYGNPYCTIFAR